MFRPFSRTSSPVRTTGLLVWLIMSAFLVVPSARLPMAPIDDSTRPFDTFPSSPISSNPDDTFIVSEALSFIPNIGQSDQDVQFQVHGMGGTIFFTSDEIVLSLPVASAELARDTTALASPFAAPVVAAAEAPASAVVRVQFLGANAVSHIRSSEQLPGVVNYLIGNDPQQWQTNVATYAGLVYESLYEGIDLYYDGNDGTLKSTYVVAPGASADVLRWRYAGASKLRVDAQHGDLLIRLADAPDGLLTEHAPIAWQDIGEERISIPVRYALFSGNELLADGMETDGATASVGFEVGEYDPHYALYIDPSLVYTTFLGAGGDEKGYAVATDPVGNVYITGETTSSKFPGKPIRTDTLPGTVPGNPEETNPNNTHIFMAKYDPNGRQVYVTYFGGDDADIGYSITVDRRMIPTVSGGSICHPCDIYLTGMTMSDNFPVANAIQPQKSGGTDVFITKIISTGQEIAYSSYFGGNGDDVAYDIALDSFARIVITGSTLSTNFPLRNAYQASYGGGVSQGDAFVARLNAEDHALDYSTYLGGGGDDSAQSIAIDRQSRMVITGFTSSADFPVRNAAQGTFGGAQDAFVTSISGDGRALNYSTFLGGASPDAGFGVAVDPEGNAYLTGMTESANFPVLKALQPAKQAGRDAYITHLSPTGGIIFSTFLGGSGPDEGSAIAIDSAYRINVTGTTLSDNFPQVSTLLRPSLKDEAFLFVTDKEGSKIEYSTYLGGEGNDFGADIAIDTSNNTYIVGYSNSSSGFPGNPRGFGSNDAFISKFAVSDLLILNAQIVEGDGGTQSMLFTIELTNPTGDDVTVNYSTRDGTGTSRATAASGDYRAVTNGLATIRAGEKSVTVEVLVNGDVEDERNEQFFVDLSNPSGESVIIGGTATGTIVDDDPGIAIFSPVPDRQLEGQAGTVQFRIALIDKRTAGDEEPTIVEGDQWRHPVTIGYRTVDGLPDEDPATAGKDYVAKQGRVTLRPGESPTADVSVQIIDDTIPERDEIFYMGLVSPPPDAMIATGWERAPFTIIDDDNNGLVINDGTAKEEDSAVLGTVLVTMALPQREEVTVNYATKDGTATAGVDYEPASGQLTFPPCEQAQLDRCPPESTQQAVEITILPDDENEPDETVIVTLSGASGVDIVRGEATLTIISNDFPDAGFVESFYFVEEGDNPDVPITMNIPVRLTASSLKAVDIAYTVGPATPEQESQGVAAEAGIDFLADSGTVSFPACGGTIGVTCANQHTQQQFPVSVVNDLVGEPHKIVDLLLSHAGNEDVTIDPPAAQLLICDNDAFPELRFDKPSYRVNESEGTIEIGVTLANISMLRSAEPVSVRYSTRDGTATAGSDYIATSGTLQFIPGTENAQTLTFTVPMIDDRIKEDEEETVILELASAEPDRVRVQCPFTSILTIVDDEQTYYAYFPLLMGRMPTVQFNQAIFEVNENEGPAVILVTLSAPVRETVTVEYETFNADTPSMAIAEEDYVPVSGTLTFPPGVTEQTFEVPIIDDEIAESDEIFFVRLMNNSQGISLGAAVATVVIRDNDGIRLSGGLVPR